MEQFLRGKYSHDIHWQYLFRVELYSHRWHKRLIDTRNDNKTSLSSKTCYRREYVTENMLHTIIDPIMTLSLFVHTIQPHEEI